MWVWVLANVINSYLPALFPAQFGFTFKKKHLFSQDRVISERLTSSSGAGSTPTWLSLETQTTGGLSISEGETGAFKWQQLQSIFLWVLQQADGRLPETGRPGSLEVIAVYTSLVMGTNGMLVLLRSGWAAVTAKAHRKSAGRQQAGKSINPDWIRYILG